MDEWKPAAIAGAIITALSALFGSQKGRAALKAWAEARAERRRAKEAAATLERVLDEKGYKRVILQLDRQIAQQQRHIAQLDNRVTDLSVEHTECRETLAAIRSENATLREAYTSLLQRLEVAESRPPPKQAGD